MRLISVARILVALLAIAWGQFVFAADYVWGWSSDSMYFKSPVAACNSWSSGQRANYPGSTGEAIRKSDTYWLCLLRDSIGQGVKEENINRYGDSCPPDSVYNSDTGSCDIPPSQCQSKAGDPTSWVLGNKTEAGLGPIEFACQESCRISLGTSSCAPSSEGSSDWSCWGLGTFTGDSCVAGDPGTGGSPPTDPTDPTAPPPDCGPKHTWSGTTCVPKPPTECDPSTGEVCPPTDPADPTDPTDPAEPGDGDGDGDDNGDGDGDGNGDGEGDGNGDGNCDPKKDPKCGDDKGDSEGEGGDTECDPAKDPDKCGKPSVAGEACDAELKCTGDVIQCAILRKNKEQICQWTYDASAKKQIADELAGDAYQIKETSIATGGLFTDALNKGRWLPQSCPSPQTVTVMGRSYSFSWEPACRFATAIGPLIVALASIFFAVFIGRGIKGS